MTTSNWERLYRMSFASVYPHYVAKAERKGRTQGGGRRDHPLADRLQPRRAGGGDGGEDRLRDLLRPGAPTEPGARQIKGVICGVRVEEIEDPLMREIRYLDKLIDELAKGKAMEKILREG